MKTLSMIAKEINGPSWSLKKQIDIKKIEKNIEDNEKKLSKEMIKCN